MSNVIAQSRIEEFIAAVSSTAARIVRDESELSFEIDGMEPDVVVAPRDETELSAILTEAQNSGVSVIPVGGGTHLGAGNVPESYDVAVSLERLTRVIAYEPDDLTVTVEPGVRLADLEALLAQHNQHLPLDPPAGEDGTAGGLVASGAYGPLRHAYGTVRDWLLGVRVVHAGGAITKAGGRVVKNVTGYDLPKLYAGSHGTLGVISEMTFKLAPVPRVKTTLSATFDGTAAGASFVLAARDAGLALHAAELLSPPAAHAVVGDPRWCVLMRVAGGAAAVERSMRELAMLATRFDATLREHPIADLQQTQNTRQQPSIGDPWQAWKIAFAPAGLALRASVMPTDVGETIEVLDRRFTGASAMLSATVTCGLIRARLGSSRIRAATIVDHARETVERRRGSLIIDAAPLMLKHQLDVFGPERADIAIMRRMKDEFDPQRILAPGRFAGRI